MSLHCSAPKKTSISTAFKPVRVAALRRGERHPPILVKQLTDAGECFFSLQKLSSFTDYEHIVYAYERRRANESHYGAWH